MNGRAGFYKNNLSGEMAYKSFVPSKLPPNPEIEIDAEIISLLTKANANIATLETVSNRIPNKILFIAMYIRKEALLSSQIEGTQATLEDILDPLIEKNINQNVEEVINYINAANFAIKRLEVLPLCNRLIKEIHAILMDGVRGKDKSPGEFRRSQNWIGGYGATLKNAKYIPPCPQDMIEAMSDLEKYINAEDGADILIKTALIHYQFETIHPFLDGNGRVGRLLILLFLIDRKILTTPILYISYFLKKYRSEYYARLSDVRIKGNFEQWIKFFLNAVIESAQDAVANIDELSKLHDRNKAKIQTLGRAKINVWRVFEYLEAHPIIDIRKTATALKLSFGTISNAIKRLEDLEILVQTKSISRNRIFAYSEYLEILRRGT